LGERLDIRLVLIIVYFIIGKTLLCIVPNSKGQIISIQKCGVIQFPKCKEIIARISALAFKMGQIKKVKAFYHIEWYVITNLHDNGPISFLFDPF